MTTPSISEESTPLRIHSNTDYDYAMRISFIKGAIHGFNRMLNYCSTPSNNVVTYEQICKVKDVEMDILEKNLKETRASVQKLYIEACNRIEYLEYVEKNKGKKKIKKGK